MSVAFPPGAPSNLIYQQLTGASARPMTGVLRATSFKSKPYVIAQYDDGSIDHFYNGAIVSEFSDARARASFEITGGTPGGIGASATITITGGINTQSDTLKTIFAGTIQLMSAAVQHNGSNDATATAVANSINSFPGAPDFSAVAVGNVVTVTCLEPGADYNGLAIVANTTGGFAITASPTLAGGIDNAIEGIEVDGVVVIDQRILHTGDNAETATLVATAINDYQSSPEYRATAVGATVNVVIQDAGSANNGKTLSIAASGDVTVSSSSTPLAGGSNLIVSPAGSETYLPGEYAKPSKGKMYSVSGSVLHFSEIDDPTDINGLTNAGFIDLSSNAEGSDRLTSIANYNNNLAVFSEQSVQIWFVDVDPAANQLLQVLNNTGAIAPYSVQEIGDSDVFYLSESGVRSLRARDSSNAAFATDIGNPIDTLILAELRDSRVSALRAKAVLEPREGRYMLAIGETVYVFSFFPASSVSAWSTYRPGFEVTDWAVVGRRLYARGDDGKLYLLGGRSGAQYDSSKVTAVIPFVSGGKPATKKTFQGLDMASEGVWSVDVCSDPRRPEEYEHVAVVDELTMPDGNAAFQATSTHLGIRLTCEDPGPAIVGSAMIHYHGGSQG